MPEGPGRGCPLAYRYGARALAGAATLAVDTLWVAGGLYGNRFALERLLELYDAEPGPKALVFNGDFHWFDVDPQDFAAVNRAVLGQRATRGNVETELAEPHDGAGCGCGYPEWVGDAEVERSNRIMERLRRTAGALPEALAALRGLPAFEVAEVGGERVAIVHGDADSLAGWAFSQESLATPAGVAAARAAFAAANVSVFASSHTCLPVLQRFESGGAQRARAVANNGAAGMPNFAGSACGLATRVALTPGRRALHRLRLGRLHVEAQPIDYDPQAWRRRFLEQWPAGSDAHCSYYERIVRGPRYDAPRALRPGGEAAARAASR
jgi:hypothetical protein